MPGPIPLQHGGYYHIFNRGNNRENLFVEDRNYRYFLKLCAKHIEPIAGTYAYCLLPNHFHMLVRIKDAEDLTNLKGLKRPSQSFSNLFNAYARAFNKTYGRTGALFQRPFGRMSVGSDVYFVRLIAYIHQNPQKHGLVDDFRAWTYSSYQAMLSSHVTRLKKQEVLTWFNGVADYESFHQQVIAEGQIVPLEPEDFD